LNEETNKINEARADEEWANYVDQISKEHVNLSFRDTLAYKLMNDR